MHGFLACVRNVGGPHDPADLLHALEVGAEAAVAAEDLLVHDGGDGQTVETVRECFPQLDVVTSLACRKGNNTVSSSKACGSYIRRRIHKSC